MLTDAERRKIIEDSTDEGSSMRDCMAVARAVEAAVLAKVLQARLSPAAWKCAKCSNVSDCEGVLPGDNWCNSCGAMDTMQPLHALKPAPLHNEGPEEKP